MTPKVDWAPARLYGALRPTQRVLVAFLLVIALTAMAAPPCLACSCAPSTKKEKAKSADVIFTGRVQKTSMVEEGSVLKARFRVGTVYKGHPKEITRVFTSAWGASCGIHLEEGKRYTVFAYWSDHKKWTSSCSGTKQGPIDPDKYGLGKGYEPEK